MESCLLAAAPHIKMPRSIVALLAMTGAASWSCELGLESGLRLVRRV